MNLARLFNPAAIAIIGASQDLTTISGQPVAHLKNHGYRGRVFPVNPKYQEIGGYKAYPTLASLPQKPDLALILVNAARVATVVRECGKFGIPFAIIFSSGFSETGAEGARLQQEVTVVAREYGIGIVGPNCQGMMSIGDDVYAGFGSPFKMEPLRHGPVSMVSQSGGFGYSMASLSEEAGLGFNKIMSIGNEAGLTSIDFIEHFVEDRGTRVIVSYIEGLSDAHRLPRIARAALRAKKPILAWKMGKTELGQKAAASHTGNLGGDNALFEALFRQTGIIEIADLQDLIDYGKAFLYGKHPCGNRVAVVSASGGAGVVLADQCVMSGLELPPLAEETKTRLRELLPSFGSLLNPVDATPSLFNNATGNTSLRHVFETLLADSNVDSLIISNSSVHGALATRIAEEIIALDRTTDKPVFVSWSARERLAGDAYRLLDAAGIPHYQTPARCGRALAALSRFAAACRRGQPNDGGVPVVEHGNVHERLAAWTGYVSEHEAKGILREYGIASTREELATNKREALAIAERIGYPLALKVQSPDIPHKTEAAAVRLGVQSAADLKAAYDEIMKNVAAYSPGARIEGVLVQEMVRDAIEVILGVINRPQFGPAIMFGLGGIYTEVLRDVCFRFAPITSDIALDMLREIRGYPILAGARGRAGADLDALADVIVKLSTLATDMKDVVAEVDINPLFVLRSGGVKAGDALIKLVRHEITSSIA